MADSDAAVATLAEDWRALFDRCASDARTTPFQSPAWLLPWWATFGTGAPIVAWRRDTAGRLSGVLPLYRLGGVARPFGVGITDYQDGLGDTDGLLAAALAGEELCDLLDLPPWAALRVATPPDGWTLDWQPSDPCPVLDIADGLGAVPAAMRRKLRMNANRAAAGGGVSVETAGAEGLDVLIDLHTARWRAGGEAGVLADPAVVAFHRAAAPGLIAAGLWRLAVLRDAAGVAVAAILALLDRQRVFFYLSGYAASAAHYSPGSLLLAAMIEAASAEGRTEAHFLRGGEAYKYAWGAADVWSATGRLARR